VAFPATSKLCDFRKRPVGRRSAAGRCVIGVRLLTVTGRYSLFLDLFVCLFDEPGVTHSVLSINTLHLFTRLPNTLIARRAVVRSVSVRRYSIHTTSQVSVAFVHALCDTHPPTPAYRWTSASPLPQFHIQIRFTLTQHKSSPVNFSDYDSLPYSIEIVDYCDVTSSYL